MSGREEEFHIMLLDDEDTIRDLIETSLPKFLPFKVIFKNFDKAERAFSSCYFYTYDLVITDFKLPGLAGDEFIQVFRNFEGNGSVPIIFISGNFSELESDRNHPMFRQVHFLEKPFEIEALGGVIQSLLLKE